MGRWLLLAFFGFLGCALCAVGVVAIVSFRDLGAVVGPLFLLIGGFFLLASLGVATAYAIAASKARAERELFRTGTHADAVIESVRNRQLRVNDLNLYVALRIRVEPRSGAPFFHERSLLVAENALPREGDRIEVAFDPRNPSKIALATDWRSDTGGGRVLLVKRPNTAPRAAGDASARDRANGLLSRLEGLRGRGALEAAEFDSLRAKIEANAT